MFCRCRVRPRYFYPRSPCGERQIRAPGYAHTCTFLSTLSLRRATSSVMPRVYVLSHFYPRSPCGERLQLVGGVAGRVVISIHALLAESDHAKLTGALDYSISIHALLAESDPLWVVLVRRLYGISIHALLAESDCLAHDTYVIMEANFYPRSPCGERLRSLQLAPLCHLISIHALLAESD